VWSRVVSGLPIDFGKRCTLAEWGNSFLTSLAIPPSITIMIAIVR
jgi:hypothetical protein